MGLTREQFNYNFTLFYTIFIAVVVFGFLNIIRDTLDYKTLLLLFMAGGFGVYLYQSNKSTVEKKKLMDEGDMVIYDDSDSYYFKKEAFFFDFFRKNAFLKDINIYTWRECIKHCDNFIKCTKLMDSEMENKHRLLDIAKLEKDKILNLFSSFIVGVTPSNTNINIKELDMTALTKERSRLMAELDYLYGEMNKKALLLWNKYRDNSTRPIYMESVDSLDPMINKNMDIL